MIFDGPLLKVNKLTTHFFTGEGTVPAVQKVNMIIERGEAVGMVGESGCGKSVTALSVMRLIRNPGRIMEGEILFKNEDLLKHTEKQMRKIRGNHISMIFQEPMTSLNPLFTIGDQIAESLQLHKGFSKKDSLDKTVEMLRLMNIPNPVGKLGEYPHQLSGGMRQRVMIAMALSCNPQLLIADEPTTALDVTIQAQILDLMRELKEKFGMAIFMITHDMGVIAEMVSRVLVMYAGKVVEEAPVMELFENPLHPYTEGLLRAIPQIGMRGRLNVIPGYVPDPSQFPKGCRFNPRCPFTNEICHAKEPPLFKISDVHSVRCWLRETSAKGEYNGEE